jgi:hypothetical protein
VSQVAQNCEDREGSEEGGHRVHDTDDKGVSERGNISMF